MRREEGMCSKCSKHLRTKGSYDLANGIMHCDVEQASLRPSDTPLMINTMNRPNHDPLIHRNPSGQIFNLTTGIFS